GVRHRRAGGPAWSRASPGPRPTGYLFSGTAFGRILIRPGDSAFVDSSEPVRRPPRLVVDDVPRSPDAGGDAIDELPRSGVHDDERLDLAYARTDLRFDDEARRRIELVFLHDSVHAHFRR